PIEIPALWNNLSFTKTLIPGSSGWAQSARMRQSLFEIPAADGELICRTLQEQSIAKKLYKLDTADRRHIAPRMVVRTETGEIEVEVPEREEEIAHETVEVDQEIKASIKMQANVAQLGAILGFNIWVPSGDRGRVSEVLPSQYHDKLITKLPLNYDSAT